MLMLGIDEGATFDGLQETFTIAGTNTVRDHFIVSLVPKGGLRRAISSMVMQINTKNSFVERIEWTQKDGTVVVTEFFPLLNGKLPARKLPCEAGFLHLGVSCAYEFQPPVPI